jgi:hypothetical protein
MPSDVRLYGTTSITGKYTGLNPVRAFCIGCRWNDGWYLSIVDAAGMGSPYLIFLVPYGKIVVIPSLLDFFN